MTGKPELRIEARARRATLVDAVADFATRLSLQADVLALKAGTLVGGYAALPGEADPSLLIARLEAMGCAVAFPRVMERDAALSFHHVPAGAALVHGAFAVPEPSPGWPAVFPQAVLVPLLAFDRDGFRLGYGGGYYDRTLRQLKNSHLLRAIGIAYAGQEIFSLPHDPHDHPLDMVVTEEGVRHFI